MPQLQILCQTQDLIAVNKPAGLSVHNDPQGDLLSLFPDKLFPVHRLDKETSGLQILARNETAARDLAGEFQRGQVDKIYLGVVRGLMDTDSGIWDLALSDKGEGRKNPQGLSRDRVPCETRYRVLKKNRYFSLLEFQLITGRQHQIRKHCALAHHHLLGDPRYGEPRYNQKMAEIYKTSRMFLHCHRIRIGSLHIESPLPAEFNDAVRD